VGRPSTTGGVSAQGSNGIQYDFMLEGVRYRPTLKQIPTEANLRHAREHVKAIKERIRPGTFSFGEEFPNFRDLHKLVNRSPWRTCNQVFDEYLQQCESRLAKHDLSLATVVGYRKVLDSIWRPRLQALPFLQVRYSMLVKIADSHKAWGKKTYNNAVSILRRAFAFGYCDHPYRSNPAWALKGARLKRKDFPRIDPFRIQDAEELIAAIHRNWGGAQGNFHEFRFFTGLRPSEQIALTVQGFHEARATLSVTKARVLGIDKDTTKTREDRIIQLSPRALAVLKRQLALYRNLKARRLIEHNQLFFKDDGTSIRNLSYPAKRWRLSLERLGQRCRRPYCARHSSVSWNLMIGKNPLFVARQHGHSLVTMWRTYAAWMDGALESDIGLIRAAIEGSAPELVPSSVQRDSAAQVALTLAERVSNAESRSPREGAPVAEFGTRFVTRCGTLATEVPDDEEKNVAERVGFEPTDGTLEIKILLENCGLLVPSKPLASPFVPVDSASSSVVSQTSASKLV
jgi:integrase